MKTMAEYIGREAAKHELLSGAVCVNHPEYLMKDDALHVIDSIPAADVVEVVRCKDCKYWQDNNDGYPHQECRWSNYETPDPDDYCSYGERKEGAD